LSKNPRAVVMEHLDINPSYFKHNKIMREYWMEARFFRCREVMEKKCEKLGIKFILADKQYPSSQLCSRCGSKRKPSGRVYICHNCGLKIDRDLNAAINLQKLAL
jgi:putative transposase